MGVNFYSKQTYVNAYENSTTHYALSNSMPGYMGSGIAEIPASVRVNAKVSVITSYSIHYTKLYDGCGIFWSFQTIWPVSSDTSFVLPSNDRFTQSNRAHSMAAQSIILATSFLPRNNFV